MKRPLAALTMVKDDYEYLRLWVAYYGEAIGHENLHVVNHGNDEQVNEIAKDCIVIPIPGDFDEQFDVKRWRYLSNFAAALRSYYDYVVLGDVDEFVVVDPNLGLTLPEFIAKRKQGLVLTPIGMEIIHRMKEETDPIDGTVIGPRRYARYSSWFCKPCIVGTDVKISRGGHFTSHPELKVFRNLYLFHMKFADQDIYLATARRRREAALSVHETGKGSMISANWFADEDSQTRRIARLGTCPVLDTFDTSEQVEGMYDTWAPRNDRYWGFRKQVDTIVSRIPDRFVGIV